MNLMQRCVYAALGLLLLAVSRPASDAPYLHPQRLVDIGGRRINVFCTGTGSPTVILDTDGDDTLAMWRFVQPAVATRTRVCSYDTPGFGFSDPIRNGEAADADANASALHRALAAAGIRGPLVLVGTSVSALYDRIYADRFPKDIAGMVLVSPNVPYQNERFARVAPALAGQMKVDGFLQQCASAARRGLIAPGKPAYKTCEYSPSDPTISGALLALIHRQWQTAALWRSFSAASSDETAVRNSQEVAAEQRSYGSMPLIVLTTTNDIAALPIPASQKSALTASWIAWHRSIAALSIDGSDRLVDGSFEIEIDRPAVVVSAIDDVMRRVRAAYVR